MYSYTPQGDRPDAPYMQITLINPVVPQHRVTCSALLDTGADSTFVPTKFLKSLVVKAYGRPNTFKGFCGSGESVPYIVSVSMDQRAINHNPIRVWSWNEKFVLVGRDILNQFCIEFNGLDQFFLVK